MAIVTLPARPEIAHYRVACAFHAVVPERHRCELPEHLLGIDTLGALPH